MAYSLKLSSTKYSLGDFLNPVCTFPDGEP
jgi:hypothetical protein